MTDKQEIQDTQLHTFEVFHQSNDGESHSYVGNVHAPDPEMALMMARDVYVRRFDCVSLWVVRKDHIYSSNEAENDVLFEPARDKVFRHPGFYHTKTQAREIKQKGMENKDN